MSGALDTTASPVISSFQEPIQLMLQLEGGGAVTRTSLDLGELPLEYGRYAGLAGMFGEMYRRIRWWIGDLLVHSDKAGMLEQVAADTGLHEQTLLRFQAVCAAVPPEIRKPSLSFGCHYAVHRLPVKDMKAWLGKAERGGWSEDELRARMKKHRRETAPTLPDPTFATKEEILEVVEAVLRDCREHEDGQHFLVPNEDIARLRAVAGQEEQ